MNGAMLLKHAAGVVDKCRADYGAPEDLFEHVAARWSQVLGTRVKAAQVAVCLMDLKMARLAHNPKHLDSLVDVLGYGACLREITR